MARSPSLHQTTDSLHHARVHDERMVLDKQRKATPRDTLAINRNLATLNRLQASRDRELDKASREKKRVELAEKKIQHESQAAIGAHKGLRAEHPESSTATDSSKKASPGKG